MKVIVNVHPNSKNPRAEQINKNHLSVHVCQLAIEGKANEAVIDALAEYYKIKKYKINLVRGAKSKNKIFEITI